MYCPAPGHQFCPPLPGGGPPVAMVQALPYSNTVKHHANWNVCYSCGFIIANGHTSITCPFHMRKPMHDINFSRQDAQQYIDMGHPCSRGWDHKIGQKEFGLKEFFMHEWC